MLRNRFRRHGSTQAHQRHNLPRNEYAKIRRDEEVNYVRDVVKKSHERTLTLPSLYEQQP